MADKTAQTWTIGCRPKQRSPRPKKEPDIHDMRVLIAVSGNNDGCADSIAATSFPWPKETIFSVLTVIVSPPAMMELVSGALDVSGVQHTTDVVAKTISSTSAFQSEPSLV